MRTLLVSDLHLGQRPGHDALRLPVARERLLRALESVDRLVLLGDIVELGSRIQRRRPLDAAAAVLSEIAARLGPEREIVLVPGNHDGVLVRDWVRARGAELGLTDTVPGDATPSLAAVTGMLAPARVSVRYPGLWVADGVYATHGHYLDRHLLPESTFGLPRIRLASPGPAATPQEYERARRQRAQRRRESRGVWSDLRERPLGTVLGQLAELTRHGGELLRHAHLTSVTSRGLDLQARHAAVPALAHVVGRLGIDARHVVFGHIHRAGPDPGDVWQPWDGAPRIVNTGTWVYEPLLLERAAPPHPDWPGGAVLVRDGEAPEVLRQLDDVPGAELSVRAHDGARRAASGGRRGSGDPRSLD